MKSYTLEICKHPGQARHPVTKQPMWEADGTHVVNPAVEMQRAIKMDGYVVAYVIPAGSECRISFLAAYDRLPESIKQRASELVASEFMPVLNVTAPAPTQPQPAEEE